MGRATRDYQKEADEKGVVLRYIGKDGSYLVYEHEGFIFKHSRQSWPPIKISAESCTTPTEFVKHQIIQIHGDTYDLSQLVYKGAEAIVTIGCKLHGVFKTTTARLKSGKGCKKCGALSTSKILRSTTDDFINKASSVHPSGYSYDKVNYVNSKTNVIITCNVHGDFPTAPYNFLAGKGCPSCGRERSARARKLKRDKIIKLFEDVHNDAYDYENVEYKDAHSLLSIICKEHGTFRQSYANHYHNKQGCPSCARELNPRFRQDFIEIAECKNYASLYLIECKNDDELFYKIGITTKPIERRFGVTECIAMPYTYRLLHLFISDGETVWELEKTLHGEYFKMKYVPKLSFGGEQECFSYIDEVEYSKLLQIIA